MGEIRENVKQNLGYFLSLRGMSQKELAMKLGVTKEDMDRLVPIHPTHGEEVFNLSVTKEEDRNASRGSC